MDPTPEQIARFWAKVDKHGPTPAHRPDLGPCWVWTGAHLPRGYGVLSVNNKRVYAHRTAYELTHGPLKPGMCALHHCDNPPCTNPAHLFQGTKGDNARDKVQKGRQGIKLTPHEVRQIRRRRYLHRASQRELAEAFGCTQTTISHVCDGQSWASVPHEVHPARFRADTRFQVGATVRALRRQQGMSQSQLARRLQPAADKRQVAALVSYISHIEHGRPVRMPTVERLAAALGCDPTALTGALDKAA